MLATPGVAYADATLVASPSSLSFTGASISAALAQTITITNTGTQPTDYTGGVSDDLAGPNAGDFTYSESRGDGCAFTTLGPGESCQIGIVLSGRGTNGTGELDVYNGAISTPALVVPLSVQITPSPTTGPNPPTSNGLQAKRCSSQGIKEISHLTAGVSPGGNPAYGADCAGAVYAARQFIHSRCARAAVSFRRAPAGNSARIKYRVCYFAYDTSDVMKRRSGKTALIAVIPTHNLNAFITFDYRFSR